MPGRPHSSQWWARKYFSQKYFNRSNLQSPDTKWAKTTHQLITIEKLFEMHKTSHVAGVKTSFPWLETKMFSFFNTFSNFTLTCHEIFFTGASNYCGLGTHRERMNWSSEILIRTFNDIVSSLFQIAMVCQIPKPSKIYKIKLSTPFVITWRTMLMPRGSLTTSVASWTNCLSWGRWVFKVFREYSTWSWKIWSLLRLSLSECLPPAFLSEDDKIDNSDDDDDTEAAADDKKQVMIISGDLQTDQRKHELSRRNNIDWNNTNYYM